MFKTIQDMKNVDIKTVPKEELVDMRETTIPEFGDVSEMVGYILKEQINWYVHRRGNIVVQNVYTDGKTINDAFGVMIASS